MKKKNELFGRVTDESGEDFYCPLDSLAKTAPKAKTRDCVEASTVERYAGNLNVVA